MLLTSVTCLLVTDDEAQDLLLPLEITQLEDWEEVPLPTHQNQIELQPLPSNSQVGLHIHFLLYSNHLHLTYFEPCLGSKPTKTAHFPNSICNFYV